MNAELLYTLYEDETEALLINDLPFAIDPKNGHLRTRAALDRESKAAYYLEARVYDEMNRNWVCVSSIEIILADVNDTPPKFNQELYNFSVPEDANAGLIVGHVKAVDPDIGISNSKVSYSLVDNVNDSFSIDEETGLVRLLKPLDREETSQYDLEVLASDGMNTGKAIFHVDVLDINDNGPICKQHKYRELVAESVKPGTHILVSCLILLLLHYVTLSFRILDCGGRR